MRKKTFTRSLLTGLILLTNHLYAQLPAIDSLKLIPANPTSNDALQVICYTTFPYGGCEVNNIHSEQQGNDILLMLDYNIGMAAYICHSVDTISIANPGAGDFQLITSITTNENDVMDDIDTLEFHIEPYLELPEYASTDLLVYPNPVKNELRLKTDLTFVKLEILSLTGEQIRLIESVPDNLLIDVSNLKKGVYLVVATNRNGNPMTRRIVKL